MLTKTKLLPLLKSNLKVVICMSLVLSLGIIMLVGLTTSYTTFEYTFDKFFEEFHMADITIATELSWEPITDKLEAENGVANAEKRLVLSMLAQKPDCKGINVGMIGCNADCSINLVNYIEQLDKKEADKIYVYPERDLYRNNNFKLGEAITLSFNGKSTEVFIGGYIGSPECAVLRDAPFSFDAHDYGLVYIDYLQLIQFLELPEGIYNQLLIMSDEHFSEQDNQELLSKIEKAGFLPKVINSFTHEKALYTEMIDMSLKPLKQTSYIIPSLLFCIATVVLYLLMNQTIMEQKREIGIFRALGFSSSDVLSLYVLYALIIAVMASIFGICGGLLLAKYLGEIYADQYMILNVYTLINYPCIAPAVLTSILVSLISCIFAVKTIKKQQPAWLMSARKKHTKISRTLRVIDKYLLTNNETLRLCVHSLARNLRRALLSAIIVMLAGVIIIIGVSAYVSAENIKSFSFEKQLNYDLQVKTIDWIDIDSIENTMEESKAISEYEPSMLESTAVKFKGKKLMIKIHGIATDSAMISLFDESQKPMSVPKSGLVLDSYTAGELGVTVGDTIVVNEKNIKVAKISFQTSSYMQYCSYETFEALFDNGGNYNLILGNLSRNAEQTTCYNELSNLESFDFVTFSEMQMYGMDRIIRIYYLGIYVTVIFAFISGMLITYNVSKINFDERMYDFAIIRALGIGKGNIFLTTFAEQLVINIIPIAGGIWLGNYVVDKVFMLFDSELFRFINVNTVHTFVIVVLIMLILISSSHILAFSRLNRLNLSEELKERC